MTGAFQLIFFFCNNASAWLGKIFLKNGSDTLHHSLDPTLQLLVVSLGKFANLDKPHFCKLLDQGVNSPFVMLLNQGFSKIINHDKS